MTPVAADLPYHIIKQARELRMECPRPIDDGLDGVFRIGEAESAEDPPHMDIDGNINGIVILERHFEMPCKDVRSHRRNLWPNPLKLEKAINNVRTGRLAFPNFCGVSVVFFFNEPDCSVKVLAHDFRKTMEGGRLGHEVSHLVRCEFRQFRKLKGATEPFGEPVGGDPCLLRFDLPVHHTSNNECVWMPLEVIQQIVRLFVRRERDELGGSFEVLLTLFY